MSSKPVSALAVAAVLILSACGSSKPVTANAVPIRGGTVVDAATFANGDPSHIDPALTTDATSGEVASLLYEGLTRTDAKGDVQDAVARTATPNADNTVWTFNLRSDIRFSNGDPVLPSSFKFAWARAADPSFTSPTDAYVRLATNVVADNTANTLVVTLSRPTPDFEAMVSMPVFSPLPESAFAGATNGGFALMAPFSKWETGLMIGDGQFKMATPWAHNNAVTLVRNDGYYGGAAKRSSYVDGVTFRIFNSNQEAYKAFAAGGFDTAEIVPGRYLDAAQSYPNQIVNDPLLATQYWGFNNVDPGVGGAANLALRQAIAMTLNRKGISIDVYRASYETATGWAPPITPGYQVRLDSGDRNVEAAKDVLRAWGQKAPTLTISYPDSGAATAQAAVLKSNLADIGISATLNPLNPNTFTTDLTAGKLQLFYGTTQANFQSYDDMLAPFVSGAPGNAFSYANPAFDSQLAADRAQQDATVRARSYATTERTMLADQPVIPAEWITTEIVTSTSLQAFHVNPEGFADYADAWLQH